MLSFNWNPTGMSDQSGDLLNLAKAGDLQGLAKLLTALERQGPACFARLARAFNAPKDANRKARFSQWESRVRLAQVNQL